MFRENFKENFGCVKESNHNQDTGIHVKESCSNRGPRCKQDQETEVTTCNKSQRINL